MQAETHVKTARQPSALKKKNKKKNTELERDERSDKHLDHMTLTTSLPLDVSIDFCNSETHTHGYTHVHMCVRHALAHTLRQTNRKKHSSHTQAFSTLREVFHSAEDRKTFFSYRFHPNKYKQKGQMMQKAVVSHASSACSQYINISRLTAPAAAVK